jgi:hypothetical protein
MNSNNNVINNSNHGARNISILVVDILLIIGLVAEYLALTFILSDKKMVDSFDMYLAKAAIFFMLIHHYLIIKNFHIIDHLNYDDLRKNGFGNWVLKSRIEDIVRLALFILFACITGEIIYLKIMAIKNLDLLNGGYYNGNTMHPKEYNLTWMTEFYINSALWMSIIMLFWDTFGVFYDKYINPSTDTATKLDVSKYGQIVAFPFKDPFVTFLISDILAFCFWYSIRAMILNHKEWYSHLISILFLGYIFFISLRTIGLLRTSLPKAKTTFINYWKNSCW